jgi:purine nucleosidase
VPGAAAIDDDRGRFRVSQRKVLIDTDAGVDDSLAILVVLSAPGVEVVGIGSTYGNCRAAQAAENALCVLEVAGADGVPVATGVMGPETALATTDYAAVVHGNDGLGDVGAQPRYLMTSGENAVEQMLRVSRDHGAATDLLALGPLSNLAAALEADRQVLSRFRSVTVMGGMGPQWLAETVLAAYPRYRSVGDPNTHHNREAAHAVGQARAALTWVGMNVTGRLLMPEAMLDELAALGTPKASFARATHRLYSDFVTRTSGSQERVFTMHDTVAAAVMLSADVIRGSVYAVPFVEQDEQGRACLWGRASGPRERGHRFVTEVDRTKVERMVRRALAG